MAGQIETLLHEVHRRLPTTRIVVMAILPKVPFLPRLSYALTAQR